MDDNPPRRFLSANSFQRSITTPENGIHRLATLSPTQSSVHDGNIRENFCDLVAELNQLSLSHLTHHNQFADQFADKGFTSPHQLTERMGSVAAGGSGTAGIGAGYNSGQIPISYASVYGDLQRLRLESALRGQMDMDMYIQIHGYRSKPHINDQLFYDAHEVHGNLVRRFNGLRIPSNPMIRDGFRYDLRRGRSFNVEYENMNINLAGLRESYNNFTALEELKGHIYFVAKDQQGCRFLQKILEEGKPEEIQMIYSEVKDHVRELMVDSFANYLMQKLFELCGVEQITQLLIRVVNDEHSFMELCRNSHGTRAMQKLLEYLTTPEQRSFLVSVLVRITFPLTKCTSGNHVIQHCLKCLPPENTKHILNVVADNCLEIAMDKSGCCVLQQCVAHAEGDSRSRLLSEIVANALVLSEHRYGNYVVQFVLSLKMPQVTSDILTQLTGSYVSLSMNKHGSNVVEKCMKESSEEQAMKIIDEIIHNKNFLTVIQDAYGNYVTQSALAIAKGSVRQKMVNFIQMHYSYLHNHLHGKRVLAKTRGGKLGV